MDDLARMMQCEVEPILAPRAEITTLINRAYKHKMDVVDEALKFFKANVLFRNFEVTCPSDKTLIYLTLFISEVPLLLLLLLQLLLLLSVSLMLLVHVLLLLLLLHEKLVMLLQ